MALSLIDSNAVRNGVTVSYFHISFGVTDIALFCLLKHYVLFVNFVPSLRSRNDTNDVRGDNKTRNDRAEE